MYKYYTTYELLQQYVNAYDYALIINNQVNNMLQAAAYLMTGAVTGIIIEILIRMFIG